MASARTMLVIKDRPGSFNFECVEHDTIVSWKRPGEKNATGMAKIRARGCFDKPSPGWIEFFISESNMTTSRDCFYSMNRAEAEKLRDLLVAAIGPAKEEKST